jgi:glyoxylase-like metal-dependent hydrolase (beta-lactamase superfamily II)
LLCLVVCASISASVNSAAEPDRERHPEYEEVKRVIEYSIGWAVEKDFDKMFSVWAQDEHLYHHWLSSKSTTRGFAEFAEHAKIWEDPKFKGTTYEFRDLEITFSRSGDVAWYSCRLDDCYEYDGKPDCVENVHQTGVLENRDGRWVHVLMHGSYPVDQIPPEYIDRYYKEAPVATPGSESDRAPLFRVRRLTDRVLVLTQISPWESNHVVIESAKGLVLVDPGHSALMGRMIREAVARELGRDQFAYVIDTHGHWGHTWGNDAFPEATVVGHERAAETMRADAVNLERRAEFFRSQVERIEARLAELDPTGEEAAAARLERDHYERTVRGFEESDFEIQPPGLTFSDRLRLDLGDLTLDMRFWGAAHSDSDIAVLIPEEKVLLMGCFFLERGPFPVFGAQPVLEPDRWLEILGSALDGDVEIEHVVLGQYSVWPRERLVAVRDYIAWLWSGVKALDAEGVSLEQAMARLPIPSQLDFIRLAGGSEEDLARYHRTQATALWRQLKESAASMVQRAIDEGNAEAGVARYRELAAGNDTEVYFDENEFNMLGYRLLGQGRVDDAIAVFRLNVERFPDSWNVYDSLGEAHAARGNIARAIELYRRSVELNPENTNGLEAIRRLEARSPEAPGGN